MRPIIIVVLFGIAVLLLVGFKAAPANSEEYKLPDDIKQTEAPWMVGYHMNAVSSELGTPVWIGKVKDGSLLHVFTLVWPNKQQKMCFLALLYNKSLIVIKANIRGNQCAAYLPKPGTEVNFK